MLQSLPLEWGGAASRNLLEAAARAASGIKPELIHSCTLMSPPLRARLPQHYDIELSPFRIIRHTP